MSTSNPYAPERSTVYDQPVEEQELAGRGTRLLAWFLDGVIASLMISLPALIDSLFIFSERRQTIHDLIADTIVVRA